MNSYSFRHPGTPPPSTPPPVASPLGTLRCFDTQVHRLRRQNFAAAAKVPTGSTVVWQRRPSRNLRKTHVFPYCATGALLGAHAGFNSRPLYPWRRITDFLWFYKGFGLTIRFPGAEFFSATAKCLFSNGFAAFLVAEFFLANHCM